MKKVVTLLFLFLLAWMSLYSQVGINADNSAPDASAGLDVNFSDKGVLLPRMTHFQRNAIASPAEGLMIYCTNCGTNGSLSIFTNGSWMTFSPCSIAAPNAGSPVISQGQIVWNWLAVSGTVGYKCNTTPDYETATRVKKGVKNLVYFSMIPLSVSRTLPRVISPDLRASSIFFNNNWSSTSLSCTNSMPLYFSAITLAVSINALPAFVCSFTSIVVIVFKFMTKL